MDAAEEAAIAAAVADAAKESQAPLDSVLIVGDSAFVAQLNRDSEELVNWVRHPNKLGIVAKTKERMMGAMLLDHDRNEKYRQAIRQLVTSGGVVLDAGCGTGLLSLLAAEAGAGTVWASEMNEVFSELSQQVVDSNPAYEPVIECIAQRTSDFSLEDGDKADLIITETMDSILTTEGMIGTIRDAKRRLGKKQQVRCIPQRARVFGRLVQLSGRLAEVRGEHMTPLLIHADCSRVQADMRTVSVADKQLLGLEFDEEDGEEEEETDKEYEVEFDLAGGELQPCALLMWWDAELAPGVVISTHPDTEPWQDHWHHGLFMLEETAALSSSLYKVKITLHAGTGMIFVASTGERSDRTAAKRARMEQPSPWLAEKSRLESNGLSEVDAALALLYRAAGDTPAAATAVSAASVMCCSVHFTHLRNPKLHLGQVCGFDHQPIIHAWNSVPDCTFPLMLYNYEYAVTSGAKAVCVARLGFSTGELELSSQAVLHLAPATTTTTTHAVLFWVEWGAGEESSNNNNSPLRADLLHPLAKTQVQFLPTESHEGEISVSAQIDPLTNRFAFKLG